MEDQTLIAGGCIRAAGEFELEPIKHGGIAGFAERVYNRRHPPAGSGEPGLKVGLAAPMTWRWRY